MIHLTDTVARAAVMKRSVKINGTRTAISLEAPFFEALQELAAARQSSINKTLSEIATAVDACGGGQINLSAAVRVVLLATAREQAAGLELCRRTTIAFRSFIALAMGEHFTVNLERQIAHGADAPLPGEQKEPTP